MKLRITLGGQPPREVPDGTLVGTLLPERDASGAPPIGARVNNDIVSLTFPLSYSATVEPLSLADSHGWRIYRGSLAFLLAKAVAEHDPEARLRVHHSFGPGLYCTLEAVDGGANAASLTRELPCIEARMRACVAADLPITFERVSYAEALSRLDQAGMRDKRNLLSHRNPPSVLLQVCESFTDLAQGPLVSRTGLLKLFALIPHGPGFVLHLPASQTPDTLAPLTPRPDLFDIYHEHIQWGRILGITLVGELNQAILDRRIDDFVMTAEALHELKLTRIAGQIASRRPAARLVLVSGPSSAGKTTFAKRLLNHLRVNGLRPLLLATDDYFVGDDRNPRDSSGVLDYEHFDAIDRAALQADLATLLAGRPVALRRFDFLKRQPEIADETLQLPPNGVLVLEGLHGLNPRLTSGIPRDRTFRIYVSALTQLGIDRNNRISTTDNRLLRRIVRDHAFRGRGALDTLRMWPAVRRGEKRWIFPYQDQADAIFNSALDYELAVLKTYVSPLLNQVKPFHPEYAEARRMTGFLHNFMTLPPDAVPGSSILREYIGGSQLRY